MVTEPGPRINFLQYSQDGGNCWTLRLPVNQNYPDLCLCVAVMECCILQMFVPSHTFPLEQAQVYCLSGNTKLFFEEIHHGEFSGHFFEMWETNRCIKFSFFFRAHTKVDIRLFTHSYPSCPFKDTKYGKQTDWSRSATFIKKTITSVVEINRRNLI